MDILLWYGNVRGWVKFGDIVQSELATDFTDCTDLIRHRPFAGSEVIHHCAKHRKSLQSPDQVGIKEAVEEVLASLTAHRQTARAVGARA